MTRGAINPFYVARIRRQPRSVQILDLLSGIGGFSLGFERCGMRTAAFCEIDPFCRKVLSQHWPAIPIYVDIRQLSKRRLSHDGIHYIDIICGGYPCQPFSVAGHQRGERDPRHLWPEMHRLIREIRPRWVVCENVDGHIELGLDTVLTDLEAAGYTCWTFIVPACAVGASHRRDRVWIIANAPGIGPQKSLGAKGRQPAQELSAEPIWRELPSPFTCRSTDGIPFLVDRIRTLGNAVVPQIPELIGRAIMDYEAEVNLPH